MEQKKQLILQILTKLKPYWNLADGLLALMESQHVSNEMLDWLIHIFAETIKTVSNEWTKDMMKKGLEALKKIKKQEHLEQIKDEEAAENLLDTI